MTDGMETFTLEDIHEIDADDDLVCISVDSPGHEFLIGDTLVPTHNSDDTADLKSEAQSIVGSIARLGRAAGVFLTLATQRPDAKMLPGETKANLGARIACGQMNATASDMVLGSGSAVSTPGHPKGRGIYSDYGAEEKMQIYFANETWIDQWLKDHNMNPDGSPLSSGPASLLPDEEDIARLRGTHLDEMEGVDNSEYKAELKKKDAEVRAEHARRLAELNGEPVADDDIDDGISDDDAVDGDVEDAAAPMPSEPELPPMVDGMKRPNLTGGDGKKMENPLDEWDDTMGELYAPADAEGDDLITTGDDEDEDEDDD
jgi:DNA segregation ATPase FtsK/SpoIIIE-like protein